MEPDEIEIEEKKLEQKAIRTPTQEIWRRFKRNKLGIAGLIIVSILVIVAIFAPWISPYDPYKVSFDESLHPPSAKHLLGTDLLGRDILSRIIWGSRVSLEVGIVAVGIAVTIGIILGLVAGFFKGIVDAIIMRLVDITYAFPFLLFAIAIMSVLGPGLQNVFIAIGILNWAWYARVMRGTVLSIREQEFVLAARAMGANAWRISFKHILPNSIAPIIVMAALGAGYAILAEAGLSFLGIGVQPPHPSWGLMLSDAQNYISTAPWMTFYPGLAIFIAVFGFILLGNGIRDAIDPRMKI